MNKINMTSMKKLIFILLITSSTIVHSEEIKLSCRINLVTSFENGSTESHQYNEIFTVRDDGKFISIQPTSSNFESVTTEHGYGINNSSQWNITSGKRNSFRSTLTTIQIDRNTGKIWYKNNTVIIKKDSWSSKGEGDCEKVDVTKKKF